MYLFRHCNGNNTNAKVIFQQMTILDKCNCSIMMPRGSYIITTIKIVDGISPPVITL